MQDRIFFGLDGVQHTLKDGDVVAGVDHGGSGADCFVGVYSAKNNGIWVVYRKKFGPEGAPLQVLLCAFQESGLGPMRIIYGAAAPPDKKRNRSPSGPNMPYPVFGNALRRGLPGYPAVIVVNDYELVMQRLKAPVEDHSRCILQRGKRQGKRWTNNSIVTAAGAGTGLGVGQLTFFPGGEHEIKPLEGSHGRLALRYDPASGLNQFDLVPWLSAQYGPINTDKVICADGLLRLLEFMVDSHRFSLPNDLAHAMNLWRDGTPDGGHQARVLLTRYAMVDHRTCVATIGLFMDLWGGFMQTTAFLHGARDNNYRIYLAGGILAAWLKHAGFLLRFGSYFLESFWHTAEKADEDWLRSIPIDIMIDPRLDALHGAAIAAACMVV